MDMDCIAFLAIGMMLGGAVVTAVWINIYAMVVSERDLARSEARSLLDEINQQRGLSWPYASQR